VARKHHHQVSQGYQRLFTPTRQIRLLDKETNVAGLVGVYDAFVRKHFCSYLGPDGEWSDELEDEWARLENNALPHARRLVAGARDAVGRNEIKVLAAIHYVRSVAFVQMHEMILQQVVGEQRAGISRNPTAIAYFKSSFGRDPVPGELEGHVDTAAAELPEGRRLLLSSMVDGYNKTLDILNKLHVQLVWPREGRSEFVFGDQALVHHDYRGRVSALGGVALGDADRAFLPLGPRLLALFTSRPFADTSIPARTVHELNEKTWQAAVRFVGASPTTDLRRSLQRWNISLATTRSPRRAAS